jgi:Bacteriophage Sf6, terminase small subunit-like
MPMSDTLSTNDPMTKKTGRKRGRPSTYSVEVMEVICERLVYGESLRQICCDETMPGRRTVFQWLEKHAEFAQLYTAAREDQIEGLLGETIEIADTDPIVERAQLRINARFAWIAKLHARKYR